MHWIRHTDPTHDGEYLVRLNTWPKGEVTTMNFTVEGGWNTYYSDGELHRSKVFAEDHVGTSTYVLGWQLLPEWGRR